MLREPEKIFEFERPKVHPVWKFIEEALWPLSHSLIADQP
jgi:hypothetical protein